MYVHLYLRHVCNSSHAHVSGSIKRKKHVRVVGVGMLLFGLTIWSEVYELKLQTKTSRHSDLEMA